MQLPIRLHHVKDDEVGQVTRDEGSYVIERALVPERAQHRAELSEDALLLFTTPPMRQIADRDARPQLAIAVSEPGRAHLNRDALAVLADQVELAAHLAAAAALL